jgi:hypothetical protein
MKIGLIGLDNGHATMFAERLNDPLHQDYVEGGKIIAGFPGESKYLPFTVDNADRLVPILRDRYEIEILASIEAVAEAADALIIASADGRTHRDQFAAIAPFRKPVFIDKFLCLSSQHATNIIRTAEKSDTPLFSSSPWRYAAPLVTALGDASGGDITGAEFYGPLPEESAHPGFLWWGIHLAEPLFTALGPGCNEVLAVPGKLHSLAIGLWSDGRVGTIRGYHYDSSVRHGIIHRENTAQRVDLNAEKHHSRHHLTKEVLNFFETKLTPVDLSITSEIIRFVEATEQSRKTGEAVRL